MNRFNLLAQLGGLWAQQNEAWKTRGNWESQGKEYGGIWGDSSLTNDSIT